MSINQQRNRGRVLPSAVKAAIDCGPLDIRDLCPEPCPQARGRSGVPCPAVAAVSERYDLTRREQQALWFVCLGLKNGSVAERMGVSLDTARLHIRNLHRKTATDDKVDLVREAWRFCRKQMSRRCTKNSN